ncbi:MAG: PSD1 and planctomycete cytochrome C domain-containing protein [Verrucomicrobia bacterium]|nr:PSD1 and planctomycete cytochrome C domain-containing protein [Verrucomicrobiota bacterium]
MNALPDSGGSGDKAVPGLFLRGEFDQVCHGPDGEARKAKLRLDQRDSALAVGKSGYAAIVPGKPGDSELVARIFSTDPEEVMPSPKSNRTLTEAQKRLLRRWIAEGATWNEHWAFVPPRRPAVPKIENPRSKIRNPIDAFVLARLAQEKLTPAPEASREALIRRVTLDLNGLPPTPAETAAFIADRSPDAYEKLVDRLLASPRYGERWAWDWLDLARYADTNGFQGDPERTMWPWRDWVVNALNANMPFDQFTIEQLAGDLLPNATREQKLASGFHRNNMFNGEGGRIAEETRVENVFDRVETTATVWLGATFTCARCHDHKFDPFKQTDYYALYDIFNQMSETGGASGGQRGGQLLPNLDLSTDAERAAVKVAQAQIDLISKEVEAYELKKFPRPEGKPLADSPDAQKLPGNLPAVLAKVEPKRRGADALLEAVPYFRDTAPDPEYARLLQASLDAVRARDNANSLITKVMIMDQLAKPRDTFVLNKGNYESKTDVRVLGHVPEVFRTKSIPAGLLAVPRDSTSAPATPERLNRLDLARWLVSPANPLAARVTVNRAWQAFFGTGFVKTAEDFGVQSERPSHPELIDWLATEFVASGWDMKALHRLIVTSATYRQSSRMTPAAHERDPENRLLARGPRYRLPSWMIRDQALAAAGLLVEQLGGPATKPYQPKGIWEEATFGKKTYQQDHGDALYRRSLYVFWRRIVGPTTFFDAGARQVCTVKVARTNTPLHALVTLNDPAFVEAARVMAQRVIAAAPDDAARIDHAFRLATGRAATKAERQVLLGRLMKLRADFAADAKSARELSSTGEAPRPENLAPAEHAAWTTLCLLVLNLDETLSKE